MNCVPTSANIRGRVLMSVIATRVVRLKHLSGLRTSRHNRNSQPRIIVSENSIWTSSADNRPRARGHHQMAVSHGHSLPMLVDTRGGHTSSVYADGRMVQ